MYTIMVNLMVELWIVFIDPYLRFSFPRKLITMKYMYIFNALYNHNNNNNNN